MEIDFPPFVAPENPHVLFPFFEANGDTDLTLLGRDDVVKKINDITLPDSNDRNNRRQKYWPIIISTSRGMGKTFLLKMIGMQKVKDHLKNAWIQDAKACGRVLSFDFLKNPNAIKCEKDIDSFFPRLMVYFLCLIFDGRQVDGINFSKLGPFADVGTFVGNQKKFNEWKKCCLQKDLDDMMDEYMRLTNIAFSVDPDSEMYKAPPVFLFDEVQWICGSADTISMFDKSNPRSHTLLSLMLTKLSTRHRPICICTGTNNGEILSISEKSSIFPQVLSLTPLVNDYMKYWKEKTDHSSSKKTRRQIVDEQALIDSLVNASYKIPRLLLIAHQIWIKLRAKNTQNREYFMQAYESEAKSYYNELGSVLKEFSPKDISHIILCCGVHWPVGNVEDYVPGTKIKWSNLIERSIIFPYLDNCYLFPFTLVWGEHSQANCSLNYAETEIGKIETYCKQIVRNLNIKDLFISYDIVCSLDLKKFGMVFETLFASSLAVKYYLWRLEKSSGAEYVSFNSIYDFGDGESRRTQNLLSKFCLNLSEGIFYPDSEALADDELPPAVVHNRKNQTAHHDILLPTNSGVLAVSVKATADFSRKDLMNQWFVSKNSDKNVTQLILLYLGSSSLKESKEENVAFLNGKGVCNGLSIDMFIKLKSLKSLNSRLN
jgi:hypothetical protein